MSMGKVFHIINPQPLNAKYVLSLFFLNVTLIDSGLPRIYLSKENNLFSRKMNIHSLSKRALIFSRWLFQWMSVHGYPLDIISFKDWCSR